MCTVEENQCVGSSIICGTASDGAGCLCYATATGRSFRGNLGTIQAANCDCSSNKECEGRIGKGAKCVQTAPGGTLDICNCPDSTTGCMQPCPTLDPGP